jgi:hypothetical protein
MKLVDLLAEEIANLKVPQMQFELSVRGGWYSEDKLYVSIAPAFSDEEFQILTLNSIEGNFHSGVNAEATFLNTIRRHSNRIADHLSDLGSRKKSMKKIKNDLAKIHYRLDILIEDRVLSETILRTSKAIQKNTNFPVEDVVKAVEFMKTLASKRISNLFTEY